MSRKTPDLVIVGTGAMACLFAARMGAAGMRPLMLGTWAEGVHALNGEGVRIVEGDGTEQTFPVRATTYPQDCAGLEQALVLVKSWQTERAASQLGEFLSPTGVALTLQNGDGNYDILARWLGAPRVVVGTTTVGATLLGPGKVRPAGEGVITLGMHARVQPITDILRQAGFVVETVSDIRSVQWGKLVINAAINPLTALLRVPNGELLEREAARSVMAAAAREAAAVAVARDIQLPYPDPVFAAETIAQRTSANYSSMLQDVLRGAATEIDAICGAVVRAGEENGIPTPVNRTLWLLIKALVGAGG